MRSRAETRPRRFRGMVGVLARRGWNAPALLPEDHLLAGRSGSGAPGGATYEIEGAAARSGVTSAAIRARAPRTCVGATARAAGASTPSSAASMRAAGVEAHTGGRSLSLRGFGIVRRGWWPRMKKR